MAALNMLCNEIYSLGFVSICYYLGVGESQKTLILGS